MEVGNTRLVSFLISVRWYTMSTNKEKVGYGVWRTLFNETTAMQFSWMFWGNFFTIALIQLAVSRKLRPGKYPHASALQCLGADLQVVGTSDNLYFKLWEVIQSVSDRSLNCLWRAITFVKPLPEKTHRSIIMCTALILLAQCSDCPPSYLS